MTKTDIPTNYFSKHYSVLIGKTVQSVRALLPQELDDFGWEGIRASDQAVLITFTDGTILVPMTDMEGNAPGALLIDEEPMMVPVS